MTRRSTILSIFTKLPVPGKVKTRLVPALGVTGATRLYAALMEKTINTARASRVDTLSLCCTPSTNHSLVQSIAEDSQIELAVQQGDELGTRMQRALDAGLEEHDFSMVLGCDCPALTTKDINLACSAFEKGNDAVIGPANDGGYYLIGLARPAACLFTDMSWGTPEVLAETRRRLKKNNLRWVELPSYTDIDEVEDLHVCDQFEELQCIIRQASRQVNETFEPA